MSPRSQYHAQTVGTSTMQQMRQDFINRLKSEGFSDAFANASAQLADEILNNLAHRISQYAQSTFQTVLSYLNLYLYQCRRYIPSDQVGKYQAAMQAVSQFAPKLNEMASRLNTDEAIRADLYRRAIDFSYTWTAQDVRHSEECSKHSMSKEEYPAIAYDIIMRPQYGWECPNSPIFDNINNMVIENVTHWENRIMRYPVESFSPEIICAVDFSDDLFLQYYNFIKSWFGVECRRQTWDDPEYGQRWIEWHECGYPLARATIDSGSDWLNLMMNTRLFKNEGGDVHHCDPQSCTPRWTPSTLRKIGATFGYTTMWAKWRPSGGV